MNELDDPFSVAADPYTVAPRIPVTQAGATPHNCQCGGERLSLTRRQALLGVGALTLLPAVASAGVFPVPCVQEKQKITPCRHKFCRHYAGAGDYHGR